MQTLQAALKVDAHWSTEHLQKSLDDRQESLDAKNQFEMSRTEESARIILTGVLGDSGPLEAIQDFSHRLLELCGNPGTNEVTLKWLRADGRHYNSLTYKKLERSCGLKIDATESLRKKWINHKVRELMGLVGLVPKEHFRCILKMIAHRSRFLIVDHNELLRSVAQCAAMRDHVGTGTNSVYRLKQAIKALLLVLKGLLLQPNIKLLFPKKEQEEVVPSRVFEVNFRITQKRNMRGMCSY